jgi:hypothetical protein
MGKRCKCGRYFLDPIPLKCTRCQQQLNRYEITFKGKTMIIEGELK